MIYIFQYFDMRWVPIIILCTHVTSCKVTIYLIQAWNYDSYGYISVKFALYTYSIQLLRITRIFWNFVQIVLERNNNSYRNCFLFHLLYFPIHWPPNQGPKFTFAVYTLYTMYNIINFVLFSCCNVQLFVVNVIKKCDRPHTTNLRSE